MTGPTWNSVRVAPPRVQSVREFVALVAGGKTARKRAAQSGGALVGALSGAAGAEARAVAERIASESRVRLIAVSLRAVGSKYASETERNLDAVFASADRADSMLYCADADTLFGRAPATSGNAEVAASILKRVDGLSGVVLFAFATAPPTLDAAFLRRLHYIVALQAPDGSSRDSLWRALLTG